MIELILKNSAAAPDWRAFLLLPGYFPLERRFDSPADDLR
jgi:hypothetical protein